MTREVYRSYFHFDWYTINCVEIQSDLPFKEGVVYNGEEDVYTIVLNYDMSPSRKREAFEHAMKHIMNEDFYKADVQQIEYDCHEGSD